MRSSHQKTEKSDAEVTAFRALVQSLTTPSILLPSVTVATVLAFLNTATALAIAALIFAGPLTPYLYMGIGLFLISSLVGGLLIPATSGCRAIRAGPRGPQAPIFAAMAVALVTTMDGQPLENVAVTLVVTILVATIATGVVLYVIGRANLGKLVRYLPYPVVRGFLAGIGYLLILGGATVAAGSATEVTGLARFFAPDAMIHLAPALAFAVVLLAAEQRIKHWMLMPSLMVLSVGIFYGALWAFSIPLEEAAANHWLTNLSSVDHAFFPVITMDQVALVNWSAVLEQSGTIAVLAFLTVTMLLLDISGIEVLLRRDLDPNHELKAAGLTNIAGGLLSAPVAFQTLPDTSLSSTLGGNRFVSVLFYSVLILGVLCVGPAPLAFMPPFVLGGVLLYIGLNLLLQWVWKARKHLPLADILVVGCILFMVARYGLLEAVGAGVALATILFVHKFSRLSVIKFSKTGAEHHSNIDRHPEHRAHLNAHGHTQHIFILHGFLFFGSASCMLDQIKEVVDTAKQSHLRYLIIDFHRVDAMDTSAVLSFAKLLQLCAHKEIIVVKTGCSPEIEHHLSDLCEELDLAPGSTHFFDDLDQGIGWCDDDILRDLTAADTRDALCPLELATNLLEEPGAAQVFVDNCELIEVAAGQMLFRQGDPSDCLFLILKGTVSIQQELPDGQTLTVRIMHAGAILGEMALFTGKPHSASAEATEDCVCYRLDSAAYERMTQESPAEANQFHRFLVRMLEERLGRANRMLRALTR